MTPYSMTNIERAFLHTFDFLLHCAKDEIVLNREKFQFCEDAVQFGGLQITPSGITSSESMLEPILSFPIPRTLTDARSWFGLVNQVTWAYSLGPVMLPFRDLVRQDSHFVWDKSLKDAFEHSKKVIVDLVKKGISTFEKNRVTCLAQIGVKREWASFCCKNIAYARLTKLQFAALKAGT